MKVSCEKCGASHVIDNATVTKDGLLFQCTHCHHQFLIFPEETNFDSANKAENIDLKDFDQMSELGEFEIESTDSSAAKDLPPSHEEFLDLPAPLSSVDLPAPVGSIDLPAPIASVDLPAPVASVDLPAPVASVDLPAPISSVDLPAPVASVDLPAPLDSGSSNLPTPKKAADSALSTQMEYGQVDLATSNDSDSAPSLVVEQAIPNLEDLPPQTSGDDEIVHFEKPKETKAPKVKKPKVSRLIPLMIGVACAVFILVTGLALGIFTRYGYFGIKLFISSDQERQALSLTTRGLDSMRTDNFKDYTDAANYFDQAARLNPELPKIKAFQLQALAARAIRFSDQNAKILAANLASTFSKQKSSNREIQKAFALLTLASGKIDNAVSQLETISNEYPEDAYAAAFWGWALLSKGKNNAAISVFKKALIADSKMIAALFGMVQALTHINSQKEAYQYTKTLLTIAPNHIGGILSQGDFFLAENNTKEAFKSYNKVINSQKLAAPIEIGKAESTIGELFFREGNKQEAQTHFRSSLKADPTNTTAQFKLGILLFEAKEYELALQHFTRLKLPPPEDFDVAMKICHTHLALRNTKGALRALSPFIKKGEKVAQFQFFLGRIAQETNNVEKAIEHYKIAITISPDFFEPYLYLSRVYLTQKKQPEAFSILEQSKAALPRSANVYNAFGEAYLATQDLDKAALMFKEALAIDPKLNDTLFNLAKTLTQQKKLDEAVPYYLSLQKNDEKYPHLLKNLGALYLELKNFEAAATSYDQALKTEENPTPELKLSAARAYIRANQTKKAFQQTEDVLRTHPWIPEARALHAEARLNQDQALEALYEIQEAVSREKRAEYYIVMGKICLALKKRQDAIDAYGESLKLNPNDLDVRFLRAKLLIREGTVKDGLSEIKKILKQHPNLGEAYLYMGIAYGDLGNEKQAAESYNKALALDASLAESHLRLGQIHNDNLRFELALKHFQIATKEAKREDPWLPMAYYFLGQVALKRNNKTLAIDSFKNFLNIAPANDASRSFVIKTLANLRSNKYFYGK